MPKTNKVLIHKIRMPVFKATVQVIICDSITKAIDYMEDKTSETIAKDDEKKNIRAYTFAYETEDGKRKYMLFFKFSAKPGEIAHESKHMINILFNWHGYKLNVNNDEMECYYLEDLVDKIHFIISKYKKKYKRGNAILSTETVLN